MGNRAARFAMPLFPRNRQLPLVLVIVCASLASGLRAQNDPSSFSDSDLEATEAKMNLDRALDENARLREKLAVTEATSAKLTESLALANSEAEVFRRTAAELKLRLEAVGIESGSGNSKLLAALNDLRLAREEQKKLADALAGLTEAIMHFLKGAVTSDPESRMTLETQLRQASGILGTPTAKSVEAPAVPATLTEAMVISIKEELSLVVTNVGSMHGVRVGMPFQVIRGEQLIGRVRVVDVREKIAGAVVQNLSSERDNIKIGDRLRVDAQQ